MEKLKAPIQCQMCEYFSPQPAGWTCSADIYIKVNGKVISKSEKRPENCPNRSEIMTECKRCPFCGSKNVSDMNGWVQCLNCNASGPDSFDNLKAVDAWNKRS